jgi:hypothetical protein
MPKALFDFNGEVLKETDKALLIGVDDKEVWFPRSIVEDNRDGTFTVPMSWAIEKELI